METLAELPFIGDQVGLFRAQPGRPKRTCNSTWRSNAQRLPNGNTLINEASFGRFFEVTRDGEIVWEYINPFFGGPPQAETNEVFRALRYSVEEIARAEATART